MTAFDTLQMSITIFPDGNVRRDIFVHDSMRERQIGGRTVLDYPACNEPNHLVSDMLGVPCFGPCTLLEVVNRWP